jgi:hypothetical protein
MGMPPFIHSARPSACAPVRPCAPYATASFAADSAPRIFAV